MPLVQLDGGYPPWGEPVRVLMEAEVHVVPAGVDLPESHFICTKVQDASGPSEYVLHVYVHDGG